MIVETRLRELISDLLSLCVFSKRSHILESSIFILDFDTSRTADNDHPTLSIIKLIEKVPLDKKNPLAKLRTMRKLMDFILKHFQWLCYILYWIKTQDVLIAVSFAYL